MTTDPQEDLFGPVPEPPRKKPSPEASALGRGLRAQRRDGRQLRDEAVSTVTENERLEWRILHDKELATFLAERRHVTFLTEDFRRWFADRGNPPPHHPNVWGAMWMHAAAAGLVKKTGGYRTMQDPRSHARVTAEWMSKD